MQWSVVGSKGDIIQMMDYGFDCNCPFTANKHICKSVEENWLQEDK